jgi:polyhydroxybutyrate depolymerase
MIRCLCSALLACLLTEPAFAKTPIKSPDGPRMDAAARLSAEVVIPSGVLQGPNPVAPLGQITARKAVFNGGERTWYEYVPATYTRNGKVPLVVAVHGGSVDGAWMFKATSWAQIADQTGFIVIYPNGSIGEGNKLRWNAYPEFNNDPAMALSTDNGVDEALFFKQLIDRTAKSYKIDRSRVYMHGQSNGGMMTTYFGLKYPEMLAAMAPASAPPSVEVMAKYPVKTALPTYYWAGETDGVSGQYNPAKKSRAMLNEELPQFWARVNKDNPEPATVVDGPYTTKIYAGPAEVRYTLFKDGIHSLPYSAAYKVWNDFFRRFARGRDGAIIVTPVE